MTWNKAWLHNFQPFSHSVTLGNNTTILVTGCSNIRAITLVDGKKVCIKLSNIYLVPALAKNLISASHLVQYLSQMSYEAHAAHSFRSVWTHQDLLSLW